MKKLYLIFGGLVLLLLILPLFSAITYQINDEIDLKIPFEVNGSAASSTADCNISIIYPNNTYLAETQNMTDNNIGEFNYTIIADKNNVLGVHTWLAFCCDGVYCGAGYGNFEITYTGDELNVETSIIYLGLLTFLVGLFIFTLFSIPKLPREDYADGDGVLIGINKLKYLRPILYVFCWMLILAMLFITSNIALAFLPNTLFGNFLFILYRIAFILTLPMFILWVIYIFYRIFQDKQMKEMIERGVEMRNPIFPIR